MLKLVALTFLVSLLTVSSTANNCTHDPNQDTFYEDELRIKPGRILEIKENTVYVDFVGKHGHYLSSYIIDKKTLYFNNKQEVDFKYFTTRNEGEWIFMFCQKCRLVFKAAHSDDKPIPTNSNLARK